MSVKPLLCASALVLGLICLDAFAAETAEKRAKHLGTIECGQQKADTVCHLVVAKGSLSEKRYAVLSPKGAPMDLTRYRETFVEVSGLETAAGLRAFGVRPAVPPMLGMPKGGPAK